jgi:tRNA-Thr(GGU) m(6)t(6)A37 methyltransferase TsaA
MTIEYTPIGFVRSPFTSTEGMPVQPSRAKGVRGSVEVLPQFTAGLDDLAGFSHVVLLCHFHRSRRYSLKVVPFLDTERRGVFATRAPARPNPIGLSVVRLLEVKESTLSIENVDLIDGTPLLDIKPYVREFDEPTQARFGWLEAALRRDVTSDDRFE